MITTEHSRQRRGEVQMAATAVDAWDERRATPEGRDDWLMPHPTVAELIPVLKARGVQRVLDLGCGVGRHTLLFAEHGFAVEAIDGAAAGLNFARGEAAARGLRLSLRQAEADAVPFAEGTFDDVLSWNVIFHGTMGEVGCRLAEIWRILRPGGLYQGTMLSKRDAQFGRGRSRPTLSSAATMPRRPHTTIATWPALPRFSPAAMSRMTRSTRRLRP
jgi:tellurite methyltransferase